MSERLRMAYPMGISDDVPNQQQNETASLDVEVHRVFIANNINIRTISKSRNKNKNKKYENNGRNECRIIMDAAMNKLRLLWNLFVARLSLRCYPFITRWPHYRHFCNFPFYWICFGAINWLRFLNSWSEKKKTFSPNSHLQFLALKVISYTDSGETICKATSYCFSC